MVDLNKFFLEIYHLRSGLYPWSEQELGEMTRRLDKGLPVFKVRHHGANDTFTRRLKRAYRTAKEKKGFTGSLREFARRQAKSEDAMDPARAIAQAWLDHKEAVDEKHLAARKAKKAGRKAPKPKVIEGGKGKKGKE